MWVLLVRVAVVFALCLSAVGCSRKSPSPVVSIQSAEPSGDVGLLEGDRVQFVVAVRAGAMDKPGKVALVVQSADQTIGLTGPVPIENGQVLTLRTEVVIPRTSTIEVVTPLYLDAAAATSILDRRYYKVIGRRG